MGRQLIIPDIHGCIKTLRYTIEDLLVPNQSDVIYFLGDYINKGPDSKSVIDYILNLKSEGYQVHTLRGNHEQLLLDAIDNRDSLPFFLSKGGDSTLESFGINDIRDLPEFYLDFLNRLEYFFETETCYIVHAGFNFALDDPFEDREAMLTIRDFQVDPDKIGNKMIIHGHHAKPLDEIMEGILKNNNHIINLDNGCVYKDREGMGNLVVYELSDHSYHVQPCLD